MKNRAKCKLCEDIIESFHRYDYVSCKCDEISIDGGQDYFHCAVKNFHNFIRIDDEGNEIVVKIKDGEEKKEEEKPKPTKEEMLEMLEMLIKNIESLPQQAMTLPINHYDFMSALLLIQSILKH